MSEKEVKEQVEKKEESTEQGEDDGAKKKRGAEKEMRKEEVESEDEDDAAATGASWQKADEKVIAQRRKVKVRRGPGGSAPEEKEESASGTGSSNGTPTKADKPSSMPTLSFTSAFSFPTPSTSAAPSTGFNIGSSTTSGFTLPTSNSTGTFTLPTTFNTQPFSLASFTTPAASTTPSTGFTAAPFTFNTTFSFSTTTNVASTSGAGIFGFNIAPPTSTSTAPSQDEEGGNDAENPTLPEKFEKSNLPDQVIPTGEEDEVQLFKEKSKLYTLDMAQNKWVEKGVGFLKVNANKEKNTARLLLRVEASLRLVLNMPLYPSIKVERNGDKAVKFAGPAIDSSDMVIYSARFGSSDTVTAFIEATNKAKPSEKAGSTPAASPAKSTSTTTTTTPTKSDESKTEESDK